jgi:hypothetical protein
MVAVTALYNAADAQGPGGNEGGSGRQGGPGGRQGGGGGRGGFGFGGMRPLATSYLQMLQEDAIQTELKLTEAQKTKIATVQDANKKQFDEMRKQMDERRAERRKAQEAERAAAQANGIDPQGGNGGGVGNGQNGQGGFGGPGGFGGGPGGFGGGRGGRGRGGFGGFDSEEMQMFRQQGEALRQQTDSALGRILSKAQLKRLSQISLQRQGPEAVAREDIAVKLNMSEDQLAQVQGAIAESRQSRGQAFQEQRKAMAALFPRGQGGDDQGRRGNRGPGGNQPQPKAQLNPNEDDEAPPPAQAAAPAQGGDQAKTKGQGRGFDREAMKKAMETPEAKAAFAKIQDVQQAITTQLAQKINKILTKRQALAFKKMKGEPFAPDAAGRDASNKATSKTDSTSDSDADSSTSAKTKKKTRRR